MSGVFFLGAVMNGLWNYQFSLGALMVAVTAVAVFSAMIRWALDAGVSPQAIVIVAVVIVAVPGLAVAKSLTL